MTGRAKQGLLQPTSPDRYIRYQQTDIAAGSELAAIHLPVVIEVLKNDEFNKRTENNKLH